ncbi:uncharacterized protein J4E78_006362 [Alternaria triticimaculans]|uniref:uncharacterized protein n=1 Tax=Alternaria triticimaculans TaxID=297637 RepID=UPI0020C3807B|nr:uncharacterized protein J4E78_006362 [Alternaria triticimaculans]KAI4657972.1 hypothetical protein J4E78_006362 [Alternaria triticimaculans]
MAHQMREVCSLKPDACLNPKEFEPGTTLCGYCEKMDPSVLKLNLYLSRRVDKSSEDLIAQMAPKAEAARQDAMKESKLVCAMRNPRFYGQEWRTKFRPLTGEPCVLLDAPGADEGRLCATCMAHEIPKDSDWAKDYILRPSDTKGKHPYARIRFDCVWNRPKPAGFEYPDGDFRKSWVSKLHCVGENTYTKYPNAMCEWHQVALINWENDYGLASRRFQEYFWRDGRLKEDYPEEELAPRVPGQIPFEQWEVCHPDVIFKKGDGIPV